MIKDIPSGPGMKIEVNPIFVKSRMTNATARRREKKIKIKEGGEVEQGQKGGFELNSR